ncbi:MAG TPA: hypothetical protein VGF06_05780 [Terriglobales bacterium]|jgi:mono/diheme cytochrome c family protein
MKIGLMVAGALVLGPALCLAGPSSKSDPVNPRVTAAKERSEDAETIRAEGEKRFHANCGRCHAAPQKFPPRMMGTIVRHMRVRAMITQEDMHYILSYMTQ